MVWVQADSLFCYKALACMDDACNSPGINEVGLYQYKCSLLLFAINSLICDKSTCYLILGKGLSATAYIEIKKTLNVENSGPPYFTKVHPVEKSWLRY